MNGTLPKEDDGRSDLEELFDLQQTKVRMELEDFCHNGEKRCQEIDNDNHDGSCSVCLMKKVRGTY